jgi:REP element-mobilizing transposase RayT
VHSKPRYKNIRLPLEAYAEPGSTWHVTICTVDRRPIFTNPTLARFLCNQIGRYGTRYHILVHAYCLMPDHLHFIGQVNDQSLITMLNAFKSFTTTQSWSHGHTGLLWQESFHDHGIRQLQDFEETARYLLDNPARVGLVADSDTYPWRGGVLLTGYEP